jgi:DNA-binding beta-propeller fold protein YncE/cytochrome b involved in lipid metabolism
MIDFLMNIDIHFVYLFIFTLGLSFGTGAALLGNVLFYTTAKDRKITQDEFSLLEKTQIVTWFGILLYAFGGMGLFTLSYESMLQTGIFYASIVIALILIVNSLIIYFFQLPKLKNDIKEKNSLHHSVFIIISGIVSLISWIFLNLHHTMHKSGIGFWIFITMYIFVVFLGLAGVWLFFKEKMEKKDALVFKKTVAVAGILFVLLFFLSLAFNIFSYDKDDSTEHKNHSAEIENTKSNSPVYTVKDVLLHNNKEDCWVIIDDVVFDATVAAEKYPEIYSCGNNVTEKYRKVTPEGISERMEKYKVGFIGYTKEEVALHDKNEDCWLIIDEFVFDATKAAKLHPAAFNCGGNASKNYHKNHGKDISNKMMKYKIGRLSDGSERLESKTSVKKEEQTLKPYNELYVKTGSWNPKNLMVIVEKDAEKLLFIDGSTNKEVGRIHDVGFQPHTSVFSPDAKYMYIISRDGWLTKIDLKTLKPKKSLKVGVNSRGTALTDNGKYLAVGNYEPGNLVIIDPDSMKILKKIPTTGKLNGEEVESRVGAVIEYKDKIIIALKDLNSVWVIDTAQKDFPVIKKRWNIGNNKTPLHDAFLTSDGKFFIVASMGSDTVWVMNTDTWKEVGEVKTGKTPHTGPGATWGDNIYVPALGEGLITVINKKTWKPVEHIKTSGPGLFVRAFNENPNYPYIWSETAFGEYKDEIYVIDARINKIIKTIIPVKGESSWHPEFTNDGKYVYVVSQTANEVEVYDAYTFEIIKRFKADTPSAVSNIGNRIEEFGL